MAYRAFIALRSRLSTRRSRRLLEGLRPGCFAGWRLPDRRPFRFLAGGPPVTPKIACLRRRAPAWASAPLGMRSCRPFVSAVACSALLTSIAMIPPPPGAAAAAGRGVTAIERVVGVRVTAPTPDAVAIASMTWRLSLNSAVCLDGTMGKRSIT